MPKNPNIQLKNKIIKSGRFVYRLRNLSKLTQDNFAKKLKFDRSYISQLENNNIDISLSTFIKWCSIFKIDPIDIFKETNWK